MTRRNLTLIWTMAVIMFGHQLYAADQINLTVVLVEVMEDITLPLFLGGMVTTLFGVGIIVSSIPAGLMVERKGFKFTLSTGIVCFSLFTLLTGISTAAGDMSLYRIGMGIGQGIWNVAYYSIIGTLFAKRRGFANSIAGNMYPLGLLWAYPLTATILVWSGSWRLPFYLFGLAGFLISALILSTVTTTTRQSRSFIKEEPKGALLRNRNLIVGCSMGLVFTFVSFSVMSFYPTYLRVVLEFSPILSGVLMSIQTWSMFIMSPVILFLSDRYGRKPFLYYQSLFSAFAVILMFHHTPGNFTFTAITCLIYGIAGAGSFPLIVAFVQDSVTRSRIGSATGIVNTAMYIGCTVAGLVTGYVTNSFGWKSTSFWLASCCIVWFLASLTAKEPKEKTN